MFPAPEPLRRDRPGVIPVRHRDVKRSLRPGSPCRSQARAGAGAASTSSCNRSCASSHQPCVAVTLVETHMHSGAMVDVVQVAPECPRRMPPLTPNVSLSPAEVKMNPPRSVVAASLAGRRRRWPSGEVHPACVSPTITVRQLSTAITTRHGDSALVARDGARCALIVTVPPPLSATTWLICPVSVIRHIVNHQTGDDSAAATTLRCSSPGASAVVFMKSTRSYAGFRFVPSTWP